MCPVGGGGRVVPGMDGDMGEVGADESEGTAAGTVDKVRSVAKSQESHSSANMPHLRSPMLTDDTIHGPESCWG